MIDPPYHLRVVLFLQVFAKHGFQQVPSIVFMSPYEAHLPERYDGPIDGADKMKMDGVPNAESIASWVNRKANINIEILRSALPKVCVHPTM